MTTGPNIEINLVAIKTLHVKGNVYINGRGEEIYISGRMYLKNEKMVLETDKNNIFNLKLDGNFLTLKAQSNIPVTLRLNL